MTELSDVIGHPLDAGEPHPVKTSRCPCLRAVPGPADKEHRCEWCMSVPGQPTAGHTCNCGAVWFPAHREWTRR